MPSKLKWEWRHLILGVVGFAIFILLSNLLYRFYLSPLVPELYQSKIDRLLPQVSVVGAAVPIVVVAGMWLYFSLGAYLPMERHRKLIQALIVVDVLFLMLHISRAKFGWPAQSAFKIDVDWGYAEIYQYTKEFYIASALMIVAIQRRRATFAVWSVFFVFLLLDDSLQFHEQLGTQIGGLLDLKPYIGLRRQVVGEVFASAVFGIIFLVPLLSLMFLGRKDRFSDCANASLFFLTICLVFFGVAIDALKNYLPSLELIFDIVEDGGEMIVMSIVVWFVHVLCRNPQFVDDAGRHATVRSFR